jgi:hypothetical protein
MASFFFQPGISNVLNAFQSQPQTGTILVPGVLAGKTSYQVPLTEKNALRVGRSLHALNEEAVSLEGPVGEDVMSEGEWQLEGQWQLDDCWLGEIGESRGGCIFVGSAGRWLYFSTLFEKGTGLKQVDIETGWLFRKPEDPSIFGAAAVLQVVHLNFDPRVFFGTRAEVVTKGYEMRFPSQQAIDGLRRCLGMVTADWRVAAFEVANRFYTSGQYTRGELDEGIRVYGGDDEWAPPLQEKGWRIPKDLVEGDDAGLGIISRNITGNGRRYEAKEPLFEVEAYIGEFLDEHGTIWEGKDHGQKNIEIKCHRPQNREERLMPLKPELREIWDEAQKMILLDP